LRRHQQRRASGTRRDESLGPWLGYPETAVWPDGFNIDEVNEKLAAGE
jgi:hypothetical protein